MAVALKRLLEGLRAGGLPGEKSLVHQGPGAQRDERGHGQRGIGSFDSVDGQDAPIDPEEFLRPVGHHAGQDICGTCNPVGFDDFRDFHQLRNDALQQALLDVDVHKAGQWEPQCRGIDALFKRQQCTRSFQAGNACLHGVAAEPQFGGNGNCAGLGLGAQCGEDAKIRGI